MAWQKEGEADPSRLTQVEWMEVLGDVYRVGVADGRRAANLELMEQISGPERMRLGRTLRRTVHEARAQSVGSKGDPYYSPRRDRFQ